MFSKKNALTDLSRIGSLLCGLLLSFAVSCSSDSKTTDIIDEVPGLPGVSKDDPNVILAQTMLATMSVADKVQQMSGKPVFDIAYMYDQPDNTDLEIPGLYYLDGPRGTRWINRDFGTTVFPQAVTRANSWDVEQELKLGEIAANEIRAIGAHVLLAPTVNQVMHPRWGRAQETYGEDAYLLGKMGTAFVKGAQADPEIAGQNKVGACIKHFSCNNIEKTRTEVNAVVDERTLREVYLPQFKMVVDEANPAMIMGSYNKVNGFYSCMNKKILHDILRDEWRWHGVAMTDWFVHGQTLASLESSLDVEMPFSTLEVTGMGMDCIYGPNLQAAIEAGTADMELVNQAVTRILYYKYKYGIMDDAMVLGAPDSSALQAEASLDETYNSAKKGIVLLKNDSILPLDKDSLPNGIVMLGRYANMKLLGDQGSSDTKPVEENESDPLVINPFEGIEDVLGAGNVTAFVSPEDDTLNATAGASAVIVVAGYIPAKLTGFTTGTGEEGEGVDRASLDLVQRDLDNISYAVENNDNVIVVVQTGGAFIVKLWIDGVKGLLWGGFMGMKGGTALADIIFGTVNPSGKICQTFPVVETDLPAFDNVSKEVTYNYYHGYRYFDKNSITPQYFFGYGLSYTDYEYSNLLVAEDSVSDDATITVTVNVKNTGSMDGEEIVQAYVGYKNTSVKDSIGRPIKELKGFKRVAVTAGETETVSIDIKASDLGYWDIEKQKMVIEKMEYEVYVGPSSNPDDLLSATFTIK